VGVSLGASGYPRQGETFDQMIIAADRAMYECKKNRKRFALTNNISGAASPDAARPLTAAGLTHDALIVELDETHVIASAAIN
jgi:hypothetical protein